MSTVLAATPWRTFAFHLTYSRLPVGGWRYMRPNGHGGTHLVGPVEDRRGRLIRAHSPLITGSADRGRCNTETMRTTLTRLRVAAEQQ